MMTPDEFAANLSMFRHLVAARALLIHPPLDVYREIADGQDIMCAAYREAYDTACVINVERKVQE